MGIKGSNRGISRVVLPQATHRAITAFFETEARQVPPNESPFEDLPLRLTQHLSGIPQEFPDRVYLPDATPFYISIWKTVRHIPQGQTRSYAWVAQQVASPAAARAVGQAMRNNPVPIIIPCHRVIGSDGSLHGFSGGLWLKRRLLEIESFNPSSSGNSAI
ncbi:methylated-DNA--[protein]-cysteine S-methyltransferase [Chloroflexota bacterium]